MFRLRIKHVDAVLKCLAVLTGDHGFEKILNDISDMEAGGEHMTVKSVLGKIREQGLKEGILLGQAQGGLNMIFSLAHDGLIPVSVATAKANMSEEEFLARMKEWEI